MTAGLVIYCQVRGKSEHMKAACRAKARAAAGENRGRRIVSQKIYRFAYAG